MPAGKMTLPDGRVVGANSREAREHRAVHGPTPRNRRPGKSVTPKDAKRVKDQGKPPESSRAPSSSTPDDAVSFTPPPPPIGAPKRDYDTRKSTPGQKKADEREELEDYKRLTAAFFAGVSALAGSERYRFTEAESEAVARPLQRIVKRSRVAEKAIQAVADPVSLFAALAFPLMVKIAAHQADVRASRQQVVAQAPVGNARTMEPSVAAPANGVVPQAGSYDSVLARLRDAT
jgi:hypothetical protein